MDAYGQVMTGGRVVDPGNWPRSILAFIETDLDEGALGIPVKAGHPKGSWFLCVPWLASRKEKTEPAAIAIQLY